MICPYLANCKGNHNGKCWKNFEDCDLYYIGGFENFINKVVFNEVVQSSG